MGEGAKVEKKKCLGFAFKIFLLLHKLLSLDEKSQ
jgi:hypothetical protein